MTAESRLSTRADGFKVQILAHGATNGQTIVLLARQDYNERKSEWLRHQLVLNAGVDHHRHTMIFASYVLLASKGKSLPEVLPDTRLV